MDPDLLYRLQEQVAYSCRAVLLGIEDIHVGLADHNQPPGTKRTGRLWYGVQNVVIGAGNVSKALWGTGRTPAEATRRRDARAPLRESLNVTDDSPLRRVKLRNDFEHLDERIEEWWAEWQHKEARVVIGQLVGPRSAIDMLGVKPGQKDTLRWFDPSTGDIIFWGNELNIPAIFDEVVRILPLAEAR